MNKHEEIKLEYNLYSITSVRTGFNFPNDASAFSYNVLLCFLLSVLLLVF